MSNLAGYKIMSPGHYNYLSGQVTCKTYSHHSTVAQFCPMGIRLPDTFVSEEKP